MKERGEIYERESMPPSEDVEAKKPRGDTIQPFMTAKLEKISRDQRYSSVIDELGSLKQEKNHEFTEEVIKGWSAQEKLKWGTIMMKEMLKIKAGD